MYYLNVSPALAGNYLYKSDWRPHVLSGVCKSVIVGTEIPKTIPYPENVPNRSRLGQHSSHLQTRNANALKQREITSYACGKRDKNVLITAIFPPQRLFEPVSNGWHLKPLRSFCTSETYDWLWFNVESLLFVIKQRNYSKSWFCS